MPPYELVLEKESAPLLPLGHSLLQERRDVIAHADRLRPPIVVVPAPGLAWRPRLPGLARRLALPAWLLRAAHGASFVTPCFASLVAFSRLLRVAMFAALP